MRRGEEVRLRHRVREPDLGRHPRFAEALASAQVAEMEPGDALFLPSMWWHHVESMSSFNLLVNYWWCTSPPAMGAPQAGYAPIAEAPGEYVRQK